MELLTYLHLPFFVFLTTTFVLQNTEGRVCPENWIKQQTRCFGIFPRKLSWAEAEVDCQTYGKYGHLASFQTTAEWDVVAKHVISNFKDVDDVWVGLEDSQMTGDWRWVDRTPLTFFPWDIGEPNNKDGQEHCAHTTIKSGFKRLRDANCEIAKSYLCKSRLI